MRSTFRITLAVVFMAAVAARLPAQEVKEAPRPGMLVPATKSAEAATEFRGGLEAEQMLSFGAAATAYRKALELDPTFALARARAAAFLAPGNRAAELERAAADVSKASAPEVALVYAMREAGRGRAANANAFYDAAVQLAPGDPAVALARANALSGEASIDALRAVVKKFPGEPAPKMALAVALTQRPTNLNRTAALQALELAQEALRLAPSSPGAMVGVAYALERVGRHDEAMTYVDRATEVTPTSEAAYLVAAEIAMREGKPEQAREALGKAVETTPYVGSKVQYATIQAMTLLFEGRSKEAIAQMSDIARKAEADGLKYGAAWAHVYTALATGAARDRDNVQMHIQAARRLGASGDWVDQDEVLAYAMAGRATEARQALPAFVKSAADNPAWGATRDRSIHLATGWVLLSENKPAEAITEFSENPDNIFAQIGLSEAYGKLHKKGETKLYRERALGRKDFAWNDAGPPIAHLRLK